MNQQLKINKQEVVKHIRRKIIKQIKKNEEKMNEKINPIEETARNKKELETLVSKLKNR